MTVDPTRDMISAGVAFALGTQLSSSYRWPDYVRDLYLCMQSAGPDHIAEARKKAGRPQIRKIFLRNGARIEPGRDDLPDWVYESVFELLDSVIQQAAPAIQYVAPAIQQAGPAVQVELVACVPDQAKNERQATLSVDSERQAPDVSALVEALELAIEYWRHRMQRYKNRRPVWVQAAEKSLAAHRNQEGEV